MNEHGREQRRRPFNGVFWPIVIAVATVVVNLAISSSTYWASDKFVSKSTFELYKDAQDVRREKFDSDVRRIADSLAHLEEQMKDNIRQDAKLDDLEKRLREQERRR